VPGGETTALRRLTLDSWQLISGLIPLRRIFPARILQCSRIKIYLADGSADAKFHWLVDRRLSAVPAALAPHPACGFVQNGPNSFSALRDQFIDF
jgi:hypothetical protein